jgi:phage/plasmid-associated DNA primase/5S rRNA maturation endonuclease (ribonuclease M5)
MKPIRAVRDALRSSGSSEPKQGNNGWMQTNCPAHDDKNASFGFKETETGAIVLHCFAGCDYTSILSSLNLQKRDLYPVRQEFVYPNKRKVVRKNIFENGMLSKNIHQEDTKESDINTGEVKEKKHVFYHLDKIKDASEVWIVEGEKDVETMESFGYVTTSIDGGSNNISNADFGPLRDKRIKVILDNDEAGTKFGKSLYFTAIKQGIFPNMVEFYKTILTEAKTDVTDAVEHGWEPMECLQKIFLPKNHLQEIGVKVLDEIKPYTIEEDVNQTVFFGDGRQYSFTPRNEGKYKNLIQAIERHGYSIEEDKEKNTYYTELSKKDKGIISNFLLEHIGTKHTDDSLTAFANGVGVDKFGNMHKLDPRKNYVAPCSSKYSEGEYTEEQRAWIYQTLRDIATDKEGNFDSGIYNTIMYLFADILMPTGFYSQNYGAQKLWKFFSFYGTGRNGKGTVIDMISSIIGVNNIFSGDLSQAKNNQFFESMLANKRLIQFSEVRLIDDVAWSRIKSYTGKDAQKIEEKNKGAVTGYVSGTIVFQTNEELKFPNSTRELQERIVYMPLKNEFNNAQNFNPRWKNEQGVRNALIDMIREYMKKQSDFGNRDLPPDASNDNRTHDITKTITIVGEWIDDIGAENLIGLGISDAFNLFKQFNQDAKISSRSFGKELRQRFVISQNPQHRQKLESIGKISDILEGSDFDIERILSNIKKQRIILELNEPTQNKNQDTNRGDEPPKEDDRLVRWTDGAKQFIKEIENQDIGQNTPLYDKACEILLSAPSELNNEDQKLFCTMEKIFNCEYDTGFNSKSATKATHIDYPTLMKRKKEKLEQQEKEVPIGAGDLLKKINSYSTSKRYKTDEKKVEAIEYLGLLDILIVFEEQGSETFSRLCKAKKWLEEISALGEGARDGLHST